VRKGGNRVRITGQLIDALTGTHLWADRFDGLIEDVFELQDKIALSVAGVIEPALQAAEMRRSAARPTADLGAYDLYLRALAAFYPITKEGIVEALELLDQAIAIDRITGRRCPGRRSATGSSMRAGPKRRKHPAARPSTSLGRRSRWRKTTRASSPTPPSCWRISARISVR
jgi:adenylate cyclase